MLIEYAGELVRRSVADTRERRCYDKLVGAGTYVFGLNEDVCVDATRAGVFPISGIMMSLWLSEAGHWGATGSVHWPRS